MTTTPPDAPPPPPQDTGPRVTRDEVRDLGRLRRSITDRKVAGVAGGLARHLDVDPLILRVAFVVLVFFGGAGLILYGAAWLLVPEEGSDRAPFNLDERTRTVALVIVGAIAALALIGDSWGGFSWFPWPLAVVALIALWLLTRNSSTRGSTPPAGPDPYAAPYTPAPASTYGPTYAPTGAPAQQNPYAGPPHAPAPPAPPRYAPPAYVAPPPRPPNPRKRGPILFWFTLALIALAEGLLGMIDLAGADVAGPAYPALAVGISGLMLLVGAFYGRAGGIILIGLVSTVVLVGATAADRWDGDDVHAKPTTAAGLDARYYLGAGDQVIDLRDVTDLQALDQRRLDVEGGVGTIEIILPEGLAASVDADIDGPGQITLFGVGHGGINVTATGNEGSADDPRILIDTHLGVGDIEVSHR